VAYPVAHNADLPRYEVTGCLSNQHWNHCTCDSGRIAPVFLSLGLPVSLG